MRAKMSSSSSYFAATARVGQQVLRAARGWTRSCCAHLIRYKSICVLSRVVCGVRIESHYRKAVIANILMGFNEQHDFGYEYKMREDALTAKSQFQSDGDGFTPIA